MPAAVPPQAPCGCGAAARRLARVSLRRVVGALMHCLERSAPSAGAWLAARAARRVPARVRAHRLQAPAAAVAYSVAVLPGRNSGGADGMTEAWGSGPVVLLLDGYHGKGQMRGLAMALAEAGYRAVAVHVPAHCPGGPKRHERGILPAYTSALVAAAALHGAPHAVIGHSLGGYAAQLAVLGGQLRNLECLVLIEALPDSGAIAAELARRARLGPRTAARLPRVLARQAGLTEADADAAARAREDESARRVLVAWDSSSACVPPADSVSLRGAWCAAGFRTVDLGHAGLLDCPGLHAAVIGHLAGPAGVLPRAQGSHPAEARR